MLGQQYDAEFERWLDTLEVVVEPEQPGTDPEEPSEPTEPEVQVTELAANQSLQLSGEAYSEKLFYVDVPANTV
ncbi:hypothetical protein OFN51_41125, partial [Escherichia coli]|nr:hypothetical protein [Escherichia coli]